MVQPIDSPVPGRRARGLACCGMDQRSLRENFNALRLFHAFGAIRHVFVQLADPGNGIERLDVVVLVIDPDGGGCSGA